MDCLFRQERDSEADKTKFIGHCDYFPAHKYFHSTKYARDIEVSRNIHGKTNACYLRKLPVSFPENQRNFTLMQKVKGLRAIPAQGTIYIAAEIDFSVLKNIHNDQEFVKLLRHEENVNVLPLSVMGQSLQGLRLLTCAKE